MGKWTWTFALICFFVSQASNQANLSCFFPPARKWETRGPCLFFLLISLSWATSHPEPSTFSASISGFYSVFPLPSVLWRTSLPSGPSPIRGNWKRKDVLWLLHRPIIASPVLQLIGKPCFQRKKSPFQVYHSLCNSKHILSTPRSFQILLFSFGVDIKANWELRSSAISNIC